MTTPILGINEVLNSDGSKELIVSEAFSQIERSLSNTISKDASGGNITLTTSEWQSNIIFVVTGHTAARDLVVPLTKKLFTVNNLGTSSGILTVKGATGITVSIAIGTTNLLYCDGIDIKTISTYKTASSTPFTGLTDVPSSYTGSNNKPIIVNSSGTALTFGGLNNLTAVTHPTSNDDSADGYDVGSIWINTVTQLIFECIDSTASAAVWKLISAEGHMPFASGSWFGMRMNANQGAFGSVIANTVIAFPIIIRNPTTVSQMAININTAQTGFILLGLYEDNNGFPGNLIEQGNAAVNAATSGINIATLNNNVLLYPPVVWAACLLDSPISMSIAIANGTDLSPTAQILGGFQSSMFTSTAANGRKNSYRIAQTFASGLPNPFGSGVFSTTSNATIILNVV